MVVLNDAFFANTKGIKSQLFFVLLLGYDVGRCNIVHYGIHKCQRIAHFVMGAEIHAFVHGFDVAFIIPDLAQELLGSAVDLESMVYSKNIFDVIERDEKTAENRLHIDVPTLWQYHEKVELRRFDCITGKTNPSRALESTALAPKSSLYDMMRAEGFKVAMKGWVTSRAK